MSEKCNARFKWGTAGLRCELDADHAAPHFSNAGAGASFQWIDHKSPPPEPSEFEKWKANRTEHRKFCDCPLCLERKAAWQACREKFLRKLSGHIFFDESWCLMCQTAAELDADRKL